MKFISDLHYYLSLPIEMIMLEQSKYKEIQIKKGQQNVPIGKLDDVEVIFLHYKDANVAKDKWTRRVERINWNNLIVKFSYMNGCSDEHIEAFENLSGVKKFAFTTKQFHYADTIVIPGDPDGQISNDTFYFKKYIDIYKLINSEPYGAQQLKYGK